MVEPLRHRQSKEAATDMFSLQPPRHIPFAVSKHSSIWSWPSQRGSLQQWLDGAYLCLIAVMSAEATVVSPSGLRVH